MPEDDPFLQEKLELERKAADRWKISDETWKGMVGVMGSGVIILLIMIVA